jgi:DNA-binding IclR family transcriptional regulator
MNTGGVTSIRRGIRVLQALAVDNAPTGSLELADAADQSRAHVSRTLRTLQSSALVTRHPVTGGHRLSAELYTQAMEVSKGRLLKHGPAVLEALAEASGHAAFVVELRGAHSATILEAASDVRWVGRSYPAYCDDGGQALLFDASTDALAAIFARTSFVAYGPNSPRDVADFERRLQQTRARGYSVTDEEVEAGVLAVAAPVRDFSGEIACAVHIEGPRDQMIDVTERLGTLVLKAAQRLSRQLGYSPAENEALPPASEDLSNAG